MHFYRPSKSNKAIKTEKWWVDDSGPHSAFGWVRRDGHDGSNGSKAVLQCRAEHHPIYGIWPYPYGANMATGTPVL
jgi:hypothetical protein